MNYLRQSEGFIIEEMDDEIVLYQPSTHKAIHLNGTAAVIWKLCDGTRTLQDLVECLVGEYPSAQSSISSEVQEAIALLLREGTLVESASQAGS
jgi:hypothetical protein